MSEANPKRVLVVAYYFPPMGLSGVQRVAKFMKYLPRHGWQPTVLTVEPGGYFAHDEGLLDEVEAAGAEIVRTASLDPTRLFGRGATVGLPAETTRRAFSTLSQAVLLPDNKIGWLPFAVAAGRRMLQARRFDAIFATAPPYTVLLIGALLSRFSGVPLLADLRDDWVGNPRHVYPTPLHRALQARLERWALRQARQVVTINEVIRQDLADRLGADHAIQVVPQGYDPDDLAPAEARSDGRLRLLYSGVFYDVQTPDVFLQALARFLDRRPEARGHIEARFVGLVPEASRRLVADLNLEASVVVLGYRSHAEAVHELAAADVLWMTVGRRPGAEQISTSKLFEYVGTRKPILGLVPEGAARQALERYGAAYLADPDDAEAVAAVLEQVWEDSQHGRLPQPDEAFVRRHDRILLAGDLARRLSSLDVS